MATHRRYNEDWLNHLDEISALTVVCVLFGALMLVGLFTWASYSRTVTARVEPPTVTTPLGIEVKPETPAAEPSQL